MRHRLPRAKALPQLDSPELLLGAVETALRETEALCGRAERALMTRAWAELDQTVADSRRAAHALKNAMDAASGVRTTQFDETVMRRLQYVYAIRDNQMRRLQHYHDEVGARLQLVARWKAALRSLATAGATRPRLTALDRMT